MAAQTMTERIRKLGPNPLKPRATIAEKPLAAAQEVIDEEEVGFRGRSKPTGKEKTSKK
jgi:hypothetical protein